MTEAKAPIGTDWAERYPERYGFGRVTAAAPRFRCPICGHPSGDCAPHELEEIMPTTKKAAAKPAAKRDPATGAPARPAAEDAPERRTQDPDSPDPMDKGIPVAPSGAVHPAYEPLGETGARNAHGQVAGGMPEASEALDTTPDRLDEEAVLAEAFDVNADGTVTARRTVSMEFVPLRAQRTSTVMLFPKGQTFPKSLVATRLAGYEARDNAKVVYSD